MNIHLIKWKIDVKNKNELDLAIKALYSSLSAITNIVDQWECFMMPPHMYIDYTNSG